MLEGLGQFRAEQMHTEASLFLPTIVHSVNMVLKRTVGTLLACILKVLVIVDPPFQRSHIVFLSF